MNDFIEKTPFVIMIFRVRSDDAEGVIEAPLNHLAELLGQIGHSNEKKLAAGGDPLCVTRIGTKKSEADLNYNLNRR